MRKLLAAFALMSVLLFTNSCSKICDDDRSSGNTCIDPSRINKDALCTQEYDPVCGCDGKTYGNPCSAAIAGVVTFVRGECGKTTTK